MNNANLLLNLSQIKSLKVKLFLTITCICLTMLNISNAQSLFLLAGQSNACGMGDSAKSNLNHSDNAFEYDVLLNEIKPLKDPVGQIWENLEKAKRGSISPAFSKAYADISHQKVIMLTAARGGSSCCIKADMNNYGTWDTSGHLLLLPVAVKKAKMAIAKTGLPLKGIIWVQGERDANAINDNKQTKEEFKEALKSVITRFRDSLGDNIPFFIVKTGYQTDRPQAGNDAVRAMQDEVAKELKNVYVVYNDTNLFIEKKWMHDKVHYNQSGLDDIGTTIAQKIYSITK